MLAIFSSSSSLSCERASGPSCEKTLPSGASCNWERPPSPSSWAWPPSSSSCAAASNCWRASISFWDTASPLSCSWAWFCSCRLAISISANSFSSPSPSSWASVCSSWEESCCLMACLRRWLSFSSSASLLDVPDTRLPRQANSAMAIITLISCGSAVRDLHDLVSNPSNSFIVYLTPVLVGPRTKYKCA